MSKPYPAVLRVLVCAALLTGASRSAADQPVVRATALQTVLDDSAGFHARHETAARLPRNLERHDVSALIALLERHSHPSLAHDELLALKDVVASALAAQASYPGELPARLTAMFRDTRHTVAWRDYCIQHLNTACTKIPATERPAIYEVFWEATAETDSTIAGTALIALADHRADSAIPGERLRDSAYHIGADSAAAPAARLTAIQIAAELGDPRILPTARQLARNPATERPLRLSAIAAIGAVGTPEDLPLLRELAAAPGIMPGIAAKAALEKLQSRHTGPQTSIDHNQHRSAPTAI